MKHQQGFIGVALILLIVIAAVGGIFYYGVINGNLLKTSDPSLNTTRTFDKQMQQNQQNTPSQTKTKTELMCDKVDQKWKSCKAEKLGIVFQVPEQWYTQEIKSDYPNRNYYALVLKETAENDNNSINVWNEATSISHKSVEIDSDELIKYEMSYIPGISYNSPKLIKKEKVTIGGKLGYKYLLKYQQHEYAAWDYETRVYLFNNTDLFLTIGLSGNNQSLLNQILSTFKFLN